MTHIVLVMKPFVSILYLAVIVTFLSCESAEEKAKKVREQFVRDSTHRADSIATSLKPRREVYDIAANFIREHMSVPQSVRFAALKMDDDSVCIWRNDSIATVVGYLEAQNSFGTYLPDWFFVKLTKRNSKWELKQNWVSQVCPTAVDTYLGRERVCLKPNGEIALYENNN